MMKQKLITLFYFFISTLGMLRLFYWLNRRKQLMLTYHNIIPDSLFDNSPHLSVSHCETIFENHIRLIKKRFTQKTILISFDDGYKNQYEIASRILEKHGLKGIFFITFKLIESGLSLAIDRMMQWVSYVPIGKYLVFDTQLQITESNRHLIATTLYEKLLSDYTLWYLIEDELNNRYAFDNLLINANLKELRFSAINKNDLSILIRNGHTIATHSWDHKPLSIFPAEIQEQDFILCQKYSSTLCNSNLYSYPYGTQSEVAPITMRLCKQYGFSAGYMNTQIKNSFPKENSDYQLPRLNLPNSKNRYLLEAKLSGFEPFIKKLLKRV